MVNLAELLRLERPLAAVDLETTGKVPDRDRIIQVGLTIHYPHRDPIAWKSYVDPEMAIPPEATHRNKIADADVAGAPTWRQLGPALAPKLTGVDFLAYNGDFDLKFLRAEMRRVGTDWDWERNGSRLVDPLRIYQIKFPRDLSAAYREFVDKDGFEGAHDAGNDVAATEQILRGMMLRFADLPRTVAALSDFCFPSNPEWVDRTGKIAWRAGEAAINFGKHAGTPLRALDRGYIKWMVGADFPADTKAILEAALEGRYPRRA